MYEHMLCISMKGENLRAGHSSAVSTPRTDPCFRIVVFTKNRQNHSERDTATKVDKHSELLSQKLKKMI